MPAGHASAEPNLFFRPNFFVSRLRLELFRFGFFFSRLPLPGHDAQPIAEPDRQQSQPSDKHPSQPTRLPSLGRHRCLTVRLLSGCDKNGSGFRNSDRSSRLSRHGRCFWQRLIARRHRHRHGTVGWFTGTAGKINGRRTRRPRLRRIIDRGFLFSPRHRHRQGHGQRLDRGQRRDFAFHNKKGSPGQPSFQIRIVTCLPLVIC